MSIFYCKKFHINQTNSAMKIGTDSILLGSWVAQQQKLPIISVLDIGTGTGILSLMVAQCFDTATITAIEIDPAAAIEAQQNIQQSDWKDRIQVLPMSLQHYLQQYPTQKFELIISNPPYYKGLTTDNKQRDLARHQQSLPLEVLAKAVYFLLNDTSSAFYTIIPSSIWQDFRTVFVGAGLFFNQLLQVYTTNNKKNSRIVVKISKNPVLTNVEISTLHAEKGEYSVFYKNLTQDFI